jgi:hypothetical protein
MISLSARLFAVAMLAPLLGGCLTSSSGQQAAVQSFEERCAARGHKPESQAFNDCLAQLEAPRERRMNERRNEMLERSNMPSAATRN